jgi:hypothetical protein
MLYCIQFLYLNLLKKQLIIRYSLEGKTHLNLISLKKNTLIIKRCAVELDIKKCLKGRRAIFIQNLPKMLPTMFRFIWPSGLEEHFCSTDRDKMCNLYRGSFIDVSYQAAVHLAKRFQRRR